MQSISQMGRMMPFRTLEMLILHQIPLSFSTLAERTAASGIRSVLNMIPIRDGGSVLPSPWNAPADAASVHIKSCETARMRR